MESAAVAAASCPAALRDRAVRRRRSNPVSRLRPLRTVPDAERGIPKPLRRVAEEGEMKIVIPGGSGQVGTILARAFHADGHDVVVLSRRPGGPAVAGGRMGRRDARRLAARDRWMRRRDQSGRPQRELPVHRREPRGRSCESRVHSTRVVGQAIARAARPPRVWLQASTATIYAHRYDAPNDEAPAFSAATNRMRPTRGDSASTWRGRGSGRSTRPSTAGRGRSRFGRR